MCEFQYLFALVPIALGGLLLFTARRSRGGSDPHCLMCGYNLTGLSSGFCPECGQALGPDTISTGPFSEMHWGRFSIGLFLVLIPAVWVVIRYFASAACR